MVSAQRFAKSSRFGTGALISFLRNIAGEIALSDRRFDLVAPDRLADAVNAFLIANGEGHPRVIPATARPIPVVPGHPRNDDFELGWLEMLTMALVSAIACDALAPRGARTMAVIGSGRRALVEAAAIAAVRRPRQIQIYDRRIVAATDLGRFLGRQLGISCTLSASPAEALTGAELVVFAAENSATPVDADWVNREAYVSAVGSMTRRARVLPANLAGRVRQIATDNLAAIDILGEDFFLAGQSVAKRIVAIGSLIGRFDANRDTGLTIFLPVGNKDAEAALLAAAISDHDREFSGTGGSERPFRAASGAR